MSTLQATIHFEQTVSLLREIAEQQSTSIGNLIKIVELQNARIDALEQRVDELRKSRRWWQR